MKPSAAPPGPRAAGWRRAALYAAVALASAVPYAEIFRVPPLHDAPATVFHNRVVLEGSLRDVLTTDFWGLPADWPTGTRSYRPLVTATYAAEVRLAGTSPAGFHAVDLVLQAASAVLFLAVLEALGLPAAFALAAALLFAVHPARSEAVVKIVGRADLLATVLLFAAILAHRTARHGRGRPFREAAALAALAGALLSKEYAVAFPFVLIAVDLASHLARGSPRRARDLPWGFWGAALALVAGYLAARHALMGAIGGMGDISPVDNLLAGRPWPARAGTALWLLAFSSRLLVAPYPLCHLYGPGTVPIASGPWDPLALAGIALLVALAALSALALRRGDPIPAVGAALLVLPLAPAVNTAGLVPVVFSELWLSVPAAGLVLIAAWLARSATARPVPRRIVLSAAVAAILVFSVLTARRVGAWRSGEALALAGLDAYPEAPKLWTELGIARSAEGRDAEAVEAFEKAVALEPRDPRPLHGYAMALRRLGRPAEAADALRRLIVLAPHDVARLWRELGEAEAAAGNLAPALEAMRRARSIRPGDPSIEEPFAEILHRAALEAESSGRYAEAAERYREILEVDPANVATLFNLGRALYLGNDPAAAVPPLERGLALREDTRARALLEEARRRASGVR